MLLQFIIVITFSTVVFHDSNGGTLLGYLWYSSIVIYVTLLFTIIDLIICSTRKSMFVYVLTVNLVMLITYIALLTKTILIHLT